LNAILYLSFYTLYLLFLVFYLIYNLQTFAICT